MPRAARIPTIQDIPSGLTAEEFTRALNDRLRRLAAMGRGSNTASSSSSVIIGGPSGAASYTVDLGVLSGGPTNITSPVAPNEGDLLTVWWEQPVGGDEEITWDAVFADVTGDDNDVRPSVKNSASFKGKADNLWWLVGMQFGRT